ncbi:MAG TPA: GrdX family protein [Acetivibrio sp.]|nr:GrdX family protein [Acetivibrio sp.]
MTIKIITNNPLLAEDLKKQECDYLFSNQQAQVLLLLARDLILKGWRLAADPLSGYNKKINSYHTIFLTNDSNYNLADYYNDIIRLEEAANHLNDPRRSKSEDIPRVVRGYMQLDYSLACSTLELLKMKY